MGANAPLSMTVVATISCAPCCQDAFETLAEQGTIKCDRYSRRSRT